MSAVNAGTTSYLTATFNDAGGTAAAPDTATWKLIDLVTGTVLQEETALIPAAQVTITIPAHANVLVNAAAQRETHRCIVTGRYGADEQVIGKYDFDVVKVT